MTNETPPPKVYLSRPRDESLEAYKEWIMELTTRMTGKTESTMPEEEWIDTWQRFWKGSFNMAETEEEKKKRQAEDGERAQAMATLGEDMEDLEAIGKRIRATLDADAAKKATQKNHPPIIPPPIADFTGRVAQLAALIASFQNGGLIFGLSGGGGFGKTELARKFAQHIADDFPAARLSIDLRGTTDPLDAEEAMRHILQPFYPNQKLPDESEQLKRKYRETFSTQKVLLLLDNAASVAQVRSLIPPAPSTAIITSRKYFTESGLFPLRLDVLSIEDARALLVSASPKLKAGSDEEVDALAKLCGYLPLALRVASSILNERPDWTLSHLLARLADERTRLKRMKSDKDNSDQDVEAVLSLSYDLLDDATKAHFSQLGVFTTPFIKASAQAVWQIENATAADDLIGKLSSLSLLDILPDPLAEGVYLYNLHDLTRLFAADQLLKDTSQAAETSRHHAVHFLQWASEANNLYLQGNENIQHALFQFRFIWSHLETAHQRLLPTQTSFPRPSNADAWLSYFPCGCVNLLGLHLSPRRRIPILEAALAAARRLTARGMEGIHLGNLGNAYADLGDAHKAIEFYEQALLITPEIDDKQSEEAWLGNLGRAYYALGDVRKAIELYEQALVIAREIGDHSGKSNAFGNLGNAYSNLGDTRKAIEFYEQALLITRKIGDKRNEGTWLGGLGIAYADLGDARKAIEYHEQALVIDRKFGDRGHEGDALSKLGSAHAELGDVCKAIEYHEQALVIDREIGYRSSEGADLANLGIAYKNLGDARKAVEFCEQALFIDREIGDRDGESIVLGILGNAYETLGEKEQAIQLTTQALAILEAIESPAAQKVRTQLATLRGESPA